MHAKNVQNQITKQEKGIKKAKNHAHMPKSIKNEQHICFNARPTMRTALKRLHRWRLKRLRPLAFLDETIIY